jgi:hypothetical protein
MRHLGFVYVGVLISGACTGGGSNAAPPSSSAAAPVSTQQPAKSGGLVGGEAKARCGGFGAAQAAEILGVAAAT